MNEAGEVRGSGQVMRHPEDDPSEHNIDKSLRGRFRQVLSALMKEGLSPPRAAAAVFVGCFIGMVPIYGFQSVAAVGLAVILKLNKPLAFAATFINNPFLQPFLVIGSVQLGHLMLYGRLLSLRISELQQLALREQLSAWLVGSVALGVILGGVAACCTYFFLVLRRRSINSRNHGNSVGKEERRYARLVRSRFAGCPYWDRNFVKWKIRLDRVFPILTRMDLGSGPVADLGCGYGITLALVGTRTPERRLIGCDLNAHRIATANRALAPLNADLSTADVRSFELHQVGLILIIDVLQYLNAEEQLALLRRCCRSLLPGGKLIVRVPDNTAGKLTSRFSLAFDRLVFLAHRLKVRPTVLSRAEYRDALQRAGMVLREQPFVNRIPLAHVLFTAEKPSSPGN